MRLGSTSLGVLSLTLAPVRVRESDAILTIRVILILMSLAPRSPVAASGRWEEAAAMPPPSQGDSRPLRAAEAGGKPAPEVEEEDLELIQLQHHAAAAPPRLDIGRWHVHEAVGGSVRGQQLTVSALLHCRLRCYADEIAAPRESRTPAHG